MAASAADIKELVLKFSALTDSAKREVRELAGDVDRNVDKMDRDLDRLDQRTSRLGGAFTKMRGTVVGALAGIVSVAAGRSLLEFGDDLEAAASRAGTSVERFQTLTRALRVLEVDGETVDKMFMKLQATMGDVQNGADNSAVQALDRLGIKARILSGEIDQTDELLDALARSSTNAGTQAQFAAEMADIFGARMSGKLVPALADGGTQLHQFEGAARDSGIMTEEMVGQLAAANEQIDAFAERVQYKAATGLANLIPHIEKAIEWFGKLDQAISDSGAGVATFFGDLRAAQTLREGQDAVDLSDARLQSQMYSALRAFPFAPQTRGLISDMAWGTTGFVRTNGGRDPSPADVGLSLGRALGSAPPRVAPTRRIPERETARSSASRAGTTADDPGARLLSAAAAYRGLGEGSARLRQLMDIDPRNVAWCAAFLNALLEQQGVRGTGSLAARSFLNFGEATNSPRPGDIVVFDDQVRGRNSPDNGHVSIFQGFDAQGNVIALGGNQSEKVKTSTYARGDVLGFRRIPGAGSADRAAEQAAREAERLAETQRRNAEAMERELESANERILSARQSTAESAGERARFELLQVAADREQADADARRDYEQRATEDPANRGRYALQLALLAKANKEVADLEASAITRAEQRRVDQETFDLRQTQLAEERDLLGMRAEFATTSAARFAIERRMLEISQQMEREELTRLSLSEDENVARQARARLLRLNERQALQTAGQGRREESPSVRYQRELRASLGDIDRQLESMAVDAMRDLRDESAAALVSVLGLEGALGNVAERLIGMALDQGILVLMDELFGARDSDADKLLEAGVSLAASAIPLSAAAAQLIVAAAALAAAHAAGGGGMGGGVAGLGSSIADGFINMFSKREHGGPVEAGRAYIVGEKQAELFVPRQSGFIVPKVPRIDVAGGGRGSASSAPAQHFYLQGNMMTPEFWAQVQASSQNAARAGAAGGVRGVQRMASRQFP